MKALARVLFSVILIATSLAASAQASSVGMDGANLRLLADAQRLEKEAVVAHAVDRFEIVLAGAQQAEIGPQQIDMRDAVAQWDLAQPFLEATVAVDQLPDQGQPAVGGVDLRIALLEFEADHKRTCGVKRRTRSDTLILAEKTAV